MNTICTNEYTIWDRTFKTSSFILCTRGFQASPATVYMLFMTSWPEGGKTVSDATVHALHIVIAHW